MAKLKIKNSNNQWVDAEIESSWNNLNNKPDIDVIPKYRSNNLVKSGGVYSKLQSKMDKNNYAESGNIAVFDNDGNVYDSGVYIEDIGSGGGNLNATTITIKPSDWDTTCNECGITVNNMGITSDSIIIASPSNPYVSCVGSNTNTLIFYTYIIPTENVTVAVIVG